jgi:hypothetical protein
MKFLQFFYSNGNEEQNFNQIKISEACLDVIEKTGIYWLVEFICHYQNFERFKCQLCQRWQVEKHPSNNVFKEDLLITCYSKDEQSVQSNAVILEEILVENFVFPFEQLTLLYQNGLYTLAEEDLHYAMGCT